MNKSLFALVAGAVMVWSFLVPDAAMFQHPELARIFFWHLPCPMMLTALLFVGVYFSLRYSLARSAPEKREWDVRAASALELGIVYAVLTMITGILFSLAQWGAWWQWDPRQTSFLMVLLVYGAYFALRGAYNDPEKRASYGAAYMMAALLPLVFLIFVFPRLPQVQQASFHPSDTVMGGNLKGQYLYVTLALMTVVAVLTVWLYRLRVRAGLLLLKNTDGNLETARGPSGPSVVARPLPLSEEGGTNG